MTTFAASVTIVDLPVGTTVSGLELFEAVQTTAGVGQSVQLSLSQIAAFTTLNSFIKTVGTGLSTSGTVTSIVAFVANNGISSAQLASSSVGSTSIAASGVVRSNLTALLIGSAQIDTSAILQANITAAAIGSTQLGALAVQQSNITAAAIGSTQIANFAITAGQIQTATIGTAQMVTGSIGLTLITTIAPAAITFAYDASSFTTTFRNLRIEFDNVCPSNQTSTLLLQVATVGTAFITGGYVAQSLVNSGATVVVDTSTTTLIMSGQRVTTQLQTSTSYGASGWVEIYHPWGTTNRVQILGQVSYVAPGTVGTATLCQSRFNGFQNDSNAALTAFAISFNQGTISTGVIRVYGYY